MQQPDLTQVSQDQTDIAVNDRDEPESTNALEQGNRAINPRRVTFKNPQRAKTIIEFFNQVATRCRIPCFDSHSEVVNYYFLFSKEVLTGDNFSFVEQKHAANADVLAKVAAEIITAKKNLRLPIGRTQPEVKDDLSIIGALIYRLLSEIVKQPVDGREKIKFLTYLRDAVIDFKDQSSEVPIRERVLTFFIDDSFKVSETIYNCLTEVSGRISDEIVRLQAELADFDIRRESEQLSIDLDGLSQATKKLLLESICVAELPDNVISQLEKLAKKVFSRRDHIYPPGSNIKVSQRELIQKLFSISSPPETGWLVDELQPVIQIRQMLSFEKKPSKRGESHQHGILWQILLIFRMEQQAHLWFQEIRERTILKLRERITASPALIEAGAAHTRSSDELIGFIRDSLPTNFSTHIELSQDTASDDALELVTFIPSYLSDDPEFKRKYEQTWFNFLKQAHELASTCVKWRQFYHSMIRVYSNASLQFMQPAIQRNYISLTNACKSTKLAAQALQDCMGKLKEKNIWKKIVTQRQKSSYTKGLKMTPVSHNVMIATYSDGISKRVGSLLPYLTEASADKQLENISFDGIALLVFEASLSRKPIERGEAETLANACRTLYQTRPMQSPQIAQSDKATLKEQPMLLPVPTTTPALDQGAESQSSIQSQLIRIPRGLKLKPVSGDGSCFFHAVCLHVKNTSAKQLRREVANQMSIKVDEFMGFFTGTLEAYHQRIECIAATDEWADECELRAAHHALRRPLVVFRPDGEPIIYEEQAVEGAEPIFIYYNGYNHYDGLLLTGEVAPASIVKSLQTPQPLPGSPSEASFFDHIGSGFAAVSRGITQGLEQMSSATQIPLGGVPVSDQSQSSAADPGSVKERSEQAGDGADKLSQFVDQGGSPADTEQALLAERAVARDRLRFELAKYCIERVAAGETGFPEDFLSMLLGAESTEQLGQEEVMDNEIRLIESVTEVAKQIKPIIGRHLERVLLIYTKKVDLDQLDAHFSKLRQRSTGYSSLEAMFFNSEGSITITDAQRDKVARLALRCVEQYPVPDRSSSQEKELVAEGYKKLLGELNAVFGLPDAEDKPFDEKLGHDFIMAEGTHFLGRIDKITERMQLQIGDVQVAQRQVFDKYKTEVIKKEHPVTLAAAQELVGMIRALLERRDGKEGWQGDSRREQIGIILHVYYIIIHFIDNVLTPELGKVMVAVKSHETSIELGLCNALLRISSQLDNQQHIKDLLVKHSRLSDFQPDWLELSNALGYLKLLHQARMLSSRRYDILRLQAIEDLLPQSLRQKRSSPKVSCTETVLFESGGLKKQIDEYCPSLIQETDFTDLATEKLIVHCNLLCAMNILSVQSSAEKVQLAESQAPNFMYTHRELWEDTINVLEMYRADTMQRSIKLLERSPFSEIANQYLFRLYDQLTSILDLCKSQLSAVSHHSLTPQQRIAERMRASIYEKDAIDQHKVGDEFEYRDQSDPESDLDSNERHLMEAPVVDTDELVKVRDITRQLRNICQIIPSDSSALLKEVLKQLDCDEVTVDALEQVLLTCEEALIEKIGEGALNQQLFELEHMQLDTNLLIDLAKTYLLLTEEKPLATRVPYITTEESRRTSLQTVVSLVADIILEGVVSIQKQLPHWKHLSVLKSVSERDLLPLAQLKSADGQTILQVIKLEQDRAYLSEDIQEQLKRWYYLNQRWSIDDSMVAKSNMAALQLIVGERDQSIRKLLADFVSELISYHRNPRGNGYFYALVHNFCTRVYWPARLDQSRRDGSSKLIRDLFENLFPINAVQRDRNKEAILRAFSQASSAIVYGPRHRSHWGDKINRAQVEFGERSNLPIVLKTGTLQSLEGRSAKIIDELRLRLKSAEKDRDLAEQELVTLRKRLGAADDQAEELARQLNEVKEEMHKQRQQTEQVMEEAESKIKQVSDEKQAVLEENDKLKRELAALRQKQTTDVRSSNSSRFFGWL